MFVRCETVKLACMTKQLSIALLQLNPTLGDLAGNLKQIKHKLLEAQALGADLAITPEFSLVGYPPEDLVLRKALFEASKTALKELQELTAEGAPAVIVGLPWLEGGRLYNCIVLIDNGEIVHKQYKHDLPNYGVFDEKRVFVEGPLPSVVEFRGIKLGLLICEDMWSHMVCDQFVKEGVELLISVNASPFELSKHDVRQDIAVLRTQQCGVPLIYLNQVGGQDELVFDGGSFVIDRHGSLFGQAHFFAEDLLCLNFDIVLEEGKKQVELHEARIARPYRGAGLIYQAVMLGLRDYVHKNGFPGVVLGLSGGIDSGVVAALAVDALGVDNVKLVYLPSPFSSEESEADARLLADSLGCAFHKLPIEGGMEWAENLLAIDNLYGSKTDTVGQNVQSRLRGLLLMALSNQDGSLLLTTGNKSEISVGYATLYGDMNGGFNPIKDVYKTTIYKLAKWRNNHIPETGFSREKNIFNASILTKEPSAELAPGQIDRDSLPDYEQLDQILELLLDQDVPISDVIAMGIDKALLQRVLGLLNKSEFKRRQAAPGVKIGRRSFGRDRRYPITNKFVGL